MTIPMGESRLLKAVRLSFVCCLTAMCGIATGEIDTRESSDFQNVVQDFDGVRPSLTLSRSSSLARLKKHVRTDRSPFRGRRSEYVSLLGTRGGERILASQGISPVAAISELEVCAWVKGNRTGFQIMARVRLPRSLDRTGQPQALYLLGDRYTDVGQWQQLKVARFELQLEDQIRAMRAQKKGSIDAAEAYIDQLAFNLYGGAEENHFWLDDLSIVAGIPIQKNSTVVSDQQVVPASYVKELNRTREDWVPKIQMYRGQQISDIARQGYNTVWFGETPNEPLLSAAAKHGLEVICPPPSDLDQLARLHQVVAWAQLPDMDGATIASVINRDSQNRRFVSEQSLHVSPTQPAADAWISLTSGKADRWIPIRNRLRTAVFQGFTGFAYDREKIPQSNSRYEQAIAELIHLELSTFRPWIVRQRSLERMRRQEADFQTNGMFSQHSGIIWFRPLGTPAKKTQALDISDALYREAHFIEPGSLEPARSRRIPGGVQISLSHEKPSGLLLLANQPQVIRAHHEHLKAIGPRYIQLLVKVIRHELIELDRRLSDKIEDQTYVNHLRRELHALHSRIAPVIESQETTVNYRQLDHLFGQIERVQRLSDVRF